MVAQPAADDGAQRGGRRNGADNLRERVHGVPP